MDINIEFPNKEEAFLFRIKAFVINKTEAFAVGYNFKKERHDILGFFHNNTDDKLYFYEIKHMSQKAFQDIIDGNEGDTFNILSDISTGFWHSEAARKVDGKFFIGMLSFFEREGEGFGLGTKTSFNFLIPTTRTVKWRDVPGLSGLDMKDDLESRYYDKADVVAFNFDKIK